MNLRLRDYAESLIALERQARDLERRLREGERRWAGKSVNAALADALQAMVADSTAAANLSGISIGDQQWLEAKRQWALAKQREHGCSPDAKPR